MKTHEEWLNLGYDFMAVSNFEKARRCFENSYAIKPDNSILPLINKCRDEIILCTNSTTSNIDYIDKLYLNGNLMMVMGDFESAINYYDNAITIDKNFTNAIFYKGIALVSLSRYEEAISCYDTLLKIDPKDTDVLEKKGIALTGMNNYEKAIACYKAALEITPREPKLLLNLGRLYQNYGNYKDAIAYYDQVLYIEADNMHAWYFKGQALSEQGLSTSLQNKFEESLKCLNQALTLEPQNINMLKDKARALKNIGSLNEMVKCNERILELAPNDLHVLKEIAEYYKNSHKYATAVIYYERLARLDVHTDYSYELTNLVAKAERVSR